MAGVVVGSGGGGSGVGSDVGPGVGPGEGIIPVCCKSKLHILVVLIFYGPSLSTIVPNF